MKRGERIKETNRMYIETKMREFVADEPLQKDALFHRMNYIMSQGPRWRYMTEILNATCWKKGDYITIELLNTIK